MSVLRGSIEHPLPPLRYWRSVPVAGLACTAVGLVLAVLLVPDDVYHTASLIPSATWLILGMLVVPVAVTVRSPLSTLHPLHVVVASPVYWLLLDILQGAYNLPGVNRGDVQTAFVAIGFFVMSLWMGALFRPMKVPQRLLFAITSDFKAPQLFGIATISFIFAFLRFAIPAEFSIEQMLNAFTVGRWETPWSRSQFGGWSAFLEHMTYFGYVLPALTVLIARKVGWVDGRTIVALLFTAIIALLESVGGGRRILGVMAG